MYKKAIYFICLLIVSSFINAQEKKDSVSTDSIKVYKPAVIPVGYTQQLDVVYTSGTDWNKKLDLYIPPKSSKPTPIIINFHGGGWVSGVKESQSGGFRTYFQEGWAVANVEYRMTHEAKAPAAVEDARCALIYIIKNAKALNIDVKRIVIMGGSAGGHLAMMAGLLGNDHRFDTNWGPKRKIKCVVLFHFNLFYC